MDTYLADDIAHLVAQLHPRTPGTLTLFHSLGMRISQFYPLFLLPNDQTCCLNASDVYSMVQKSRTCFEQ